MRGTFYCDSGVVEAFLDNFDDFCFGDGRRYLRAEVGVEAAQHVAAREEQRPVGGVLGGEVQRAEQRLAELFFRQRAAFFVLGVLFDYLYDLVSLF